MCWLTVLVTLSSRKVSKNSLNQMATMSWRWASSPTPNSLHLKKWKSQVWLDKRRQLKTMKTSSMHLQRRSALVELTNGSWVVLITLKQLLSISTLFRLRIKLRVQMFISSSRLLTCTHRDRKGSELPRVKESWVLPMISKKLRQVSIKKQRLFWSPVTVSTTP